MAIYMAPPMTELSSTLSACVLSMVDISWCIFSLPESSCDLF